MALPIKTTVDDIEKLCTFLGRKPTGASVKEAKAVIDSKHLDGRKLAAVRGWGFVEDIGEKMKLTPLGRTFIRGNKEQQQQLLLRVISSCTPYSAMVERASHKQEESISTVDVGAHWHDHFPDEVGKADATLNDQAITFFNIAQGAGLGELTVGRRGSPTRFVWDQKALAKYDPGSTSTPPDGDSDEEQKVDPQTQMHRLISLILRIQLPLRVPKRPYLDSLSFLHMGATRLLWNNLRKFFDSSTSLLKLRLRSPILDARLGSK